MVDAVDSKSTGGNLVGVRVSPPAPVMIKANLLILLALKLTISGDFFIFDAFGD